MALKICISCRSKEHLRNSEALRMTLYSGRSTAVYRYTSNRRSVPGCRSEIVALDSAQTQDKIILWKIASKFYIKYYSIFDTRNCLIMWIYFLNRRLFGFMFSIAVCSLSHCVNNSVSNIFSCALPVCNAWILCYGFCCICCARNFYVMRCFWICE